MDKRPIERGDRFLDEDHRRPGRTVQVRKALLGAYYVQTETHPTNPDAIGRHSWVSDKTLRRRYKRISA